MPVMALDLLYLASWLQLIPLFLIQTRPEQNNPLQWWKLGSRWLCGSKSEASRYVGNESSASSSFRPCWEHQSALPQ